MSIGEYEKKEKLHSFSILNETANKPNIGSNRHRPTKNVASICSVCI